MIDYLGVVAIVMHIICGFGFVKLPNIKMLDIPTIIKVVLFPVFLFVLAVIDTDSIDFD